LSMAHWIPSARLGVTQSRWGPMVVSLGVALSMASTEAAVARVQTQERRNQFGRRSNGGAHRQDRALFRRAGGSDPADHFSGRAGSSPLATAFDQTATSCAPDPDAAECTKPRSQASSQQSARSASVASVFSRVYYGTTKATRREQPAGGRPSPVPEQST